MKLFDLNPHEAKHLKRVALWHLGYIATVALFFALIYYFGLYKSHRLLRESPLFSYVAPISTAIFVIISPWRNSWRAAILETIKKMDNEPVFCLMGGIVFTVGLFLASVVLWGLGAVGPALLYLEERAGLFTEQFFY
jgi:hypothetical protein